jgi:hypothetical protein
MEAKKGLQRLFRWPGPRPEPDAVDPADMGTAFGMELSIDEATGRNDAVSAPGGTKARTRAQASSRPKRR